MKNQINISFHLYSSGEYLVLLVQTILKSLIRVTEC